MIFKPTAFSSALKKSTLALTAFLALAGAAAAQTLPGFSLHVFATAPQGMSAPDSLLVLGTHLWAGYGDGAAKDGSSGASVVIEYNFDGSIQNQTTIPGHNDGLRYDPATGKIVALQNEDANPVIATIDPNTGIVTTYNPLKSVNGGGGFDDLAIIGGRLFASASNPTLNSQGQNRYPAIVDLVPTQNGNYSYQTLLAGNATAIDVITGRPVKLNLTDPDSLTITPGGNILMTDQQDAQLIEVRLGHGQGPFVSRIPLLSGVQLDDTVYATSNSGTLYIADTTGNTIYALDSQQFVTGKPYSASIGVPASGSQPAVPAFVGRLYPAIGAVVPVVNPNVLLSPHGLAFRAH